MKKAKCKLVRVCSDEVVIKRAHLREDIREARQGIKRDERALAGLAQPPQVEVRWKNPDSVLSNRLVFTVLDRATLEALTGPVNPRYIGSFGMDERYPVRAYTDLNLVAFDRLSHMGPVWGRVNQWRMVGDRLELGIQYQHPGHLPSVTVETMPAGQGVEQLIDYVAERGGI